MTIAQERLTKTIPTIAYIKLVQVFLSSSGFHLATTSLAQIYKKTPIVIKANRLNIDSLKNLKIPLSQSVHSTVISSGLGIISSLIDAPLDANAKYKDEKKVIIKKKKDFNIYKNLKNTYIIYNVNYWPSRNR